MNSQDLKILRIIDFIRRQNVYLSRAGWSRNSAWLPYPGATILLLKSILCRSILSERRNFQNLYILHGDTGSFPGNLLPQSRGRDSQSNLAHRLQHKCSHVFGNGFFLIKVEMIFLKVLKPIMSLIRFNF